MYKVGDRVIFTFLGQRQKGSVTEKLKGGKYKVVSDDGTTYPFIYGKEPVKKKGVKYEKPLGVIIKKLSK